MSKTEQSSGIAAIGVPEYGEIDNATWNAMGQEGNSPVIPEGSEKALIKCPVHYTRGQIWDYSSRKICNLPNNDGVEPKELGELLVTIINTYQRSVSQADRGKDG